MCVIVDANSLSSVFNPTDEYHEDFQPVYDWIIKGKGKLIMGGTHYNKEISKCRKYLKIINVLKKQSKVYTADSEKVDQLEADIRSKIPDPDFDDPHLPAIAIVGKCKVICSRDTRSIKFVTSPCLYPNKISIPKYYCSRRNISLLSDKYIHSFHKPLNSFNKATILQVSQLIHDI